VRVLFSLFRPPSSTFFVLVFPFATLSSIGFLVSFFSSFLRGLRTSSGALYVSSVFSPSESDFFPP